MNIGRVCACVCVQERVICILEHWDVFIEMFSFLTGSTTRTIVMKFLLTAFIKNK